MPSHSTAALILLVDALRRAGEEPGPALRRFGLDVRRLDPTAVLDHALEVRVNEAIAGSLRDPLAGLEVGSSLGIGGYGPFTLLLLTCEHLLAGIRTAIEFEPLTFLFGKLAFEPGRAASALLLRPAAFDGPAFRFRVDLEVAGTWRLMHDLHGVARVDVAPVKIVMPYARPREAAAYERRFDCPVQWDGREARYVFRNDVLRSRFATADAGAHAVLRAQCQRLLVEREGRTADVASRVRSHLAANLGAPPTCAETARLLGLSERSLRRLLGAEGTGYRRILDEVRLRRAQELLRDARVPVEQVAQRLGYGEPAAFIHAFRRWTGSSPAAYRRARRHGA